MSELFYPRPKAGDTIAVWFSCGAASAVAAKRTVELYGDTCVIWVVNNPVKEEGEDNPRFLRDVQKWLGVPIIEAFNKDFPECSAVQIWDKRNYMAGVKGAPCTMLLKKEARYQFELSHNIDWHVLGFTADKKELKRHERFVRYERSNVLPILIEEGITKKKCYRIIEEAGLRLPEAYQLGFPNANCYGCVKATGITYWNHVRKMKPDVFEARAIQSRAIGAKLVRFNGKRIFLDELPAYAVGGTMESYECGIFCDTK